MTEALSQETLVRWRGKEFWAEDELLALLFGENPEISPREVEQDPPDIRAARICIWADPPIGIKAKKVHEKVHGQYKQMRYYAPEDVFQWAANKHYPDFPKFPDPIDWSFWLAMPEVELWEACALSLYISPDSLKPHPQGWMASSVLGPFFESKSFQSKGIEDQFAKRMRLVKTSIRQISGRVDATTVQLVDLVKWWPLSMGLLPVELQSLHQDSLCSEIPGVVPLFDKKQPSVEQAAIPVVSIEQPCNQVARTKPDGGDSLTPIIWEICYDMRDADQEIKPRHVMAELRARADKKIWPLVGVVDGGVKFEFEKGEESEIDNDALRQRIKKWKNAITGT
jgi:hypothetical protein